MIEHLIHNLQFSLDGMFSYMTPKLWMLGVIVPFLMALFFTALVHPLIVRMAVSRNMFDNPDRRKLQARPVPVMGGLAVFFGIVVGAGATSVFFNSYALFTCVITMTVMMYVGMLDDMVGLSPVLRLFVELCLVAFVVYMDKTSINDFHGLLGTGKLPVWASLPLCSVACLGIINSINLIDGVDGLSSGICIFACLCFGVAFCSSYDGTMAVMASLAAGALVPFFFHNVFGQKSKMFVGDSGTLMMGMLMSIFCMRMIDNTSLVAYNHPRMGVVAFALSVLSVPVFDALRVMFGRILKGESPFHADRSHLHHLFIELGFSHVGTTVAVVSLNALNVVCWLVCYLFGGDATVQFAVVFVVGLLNTNGVYYAVRKMNHHRWPHRMLKRLARMSHMEAGRTFLAIRRVMDAL